MGISISLAIHVLGRGRRHRPNLGIEDPMNVTEEIELDRRLSFHRAHDKSCVSERNILLINAWCYRLCHSPAIICAKPCRKEASKRSSSSPDFLCNLSAHPRQRGKCGRRGHLLRPTSFRCMPPNGPTCKHHSQRESEEQDSVLIQPRFRRSIYATQGKTIIPTQPLP